MGCDYLFEFSKKISKHNKQTQPSQGIHFRMLPVKITYNIWTYEKEKLIVFWYKSQSPPKDLYIGPHIWPYLLE